MTWIIQLHPFGCKGLKDFRIWSKRNPVTDVGSGWDSLRSQIPGIGIDPSKISKAKSKNSMLGNCGELFFNISYMELLYFLLIFELFNPRKFHGFVFHWIEFPIKKLIANPSLLKLSLNFLAFFKCSLFCIKSQT